MAFNPRYGRMRQKAGREGQREGERGKGREGEREGRRQEGGGRGRKREGGRDIDLSRAENRQLTPGPYPHIHLLVLWCGSHRGLVRMCSGKEEQVCLTSLHLSCSYDHS